jgi:hypothetical protein
MLEGTTIGAAFESTTIAANTLWPPASSVSELSALCDPCLG